jgi:uncharacterized Zn finger protein
MKEPAKVFAVWNSCKLTPCIKCGSQHFELMNRKGLDLVRCHYCGAVVNQKEDGF